MNGDGEWNEKNLVFCIYLWTGNPIDYHGTDLSCPEITQELDSPLQQ